MTKLLFYYLHKERFVFSLNTTFKFVVAGILWVVLSDLALFIFHKPGADHFSLFHLEVLKGICFVVAMGIIFFFILQQHRRTETTIDRQDFFRRNPLPMWIYNLETLQFLEVNEAALIMYGYSRKEFLSMTVDQIRPTEDLSRMQHAVGQLQRGHRLLGQWLHMRKDGTLLHVEVSAYSILYNNQHAGLIMSTDITNQVKAEEDLRVAKMEFERKLLDKTAALALVNKELEVRIREINATNDDLIDLNTLLLNNNRTLAVQSSTQLREKTELVRRLMDKVSDCVWSFDLTGKGDDHVSRAALTFFGVDKDQVMDCPNFWLSYIAAEDRGEVAEKLGRLEHDHCAEFCYRIAFSQESRRVRQTISIIHDDEGNPARMENFVAEV